MKKKKDLLVVFAIFSFLSVPFASEICSGYLSYFYLDKEEFLLWHFTSLKNILPYKDIFYPYGFLHYFRNYNFVIFFLYYIMSPLLFSILFFIFKEVFKEKLILYSSFAIFYLFVLKIIGFQTFSRYGILAVFLLLFCYVILIYKKRIKKALVYLGIVTGITFSLINDVGMYLLLCFIFVFVFARLFGIRSRLALSNVTNVLEESFLIFLGFLIGITPLVLFLIYQGSVGAFITYFKDVSDISVVAKTPFFTFLNSPSNIFTIIILYFVIILSLFKIFTKQKLTMLFLFQVSLIAAIFIMEQKSIIRSIDSQITFVSLLLLMFMLYEFLSSFLKTSVIKPAIFTSLILIIVIPYSFTVETKKIDLLNSLNSIYLSANNKCFDSNLNAFKKTNPSYRKIIDYLRQQNDFNGKVFSFPMGDSAFYVLLNQKPPYYNAIFEGATLSKQKSTIKYIQDNNVEYVILNTSKSAIQDGVPDYIRQAFLFQYILNNYSPSKVLGNHLILKKETGDFLASGILAQVRDYKNYLLDVYLYKIPYSEGFYKYDYLVKNSKLLLEDLDIDSINRVLREGSFKSDKKVVVVIPSIDHKPNHLDSISFQTADRGSTTIFYNLCKKDEPCIVNLSRLPLFYQNRVVAKISVGKKFEGYIKIFELSKPGDLW